MRTIHHPWQRMLLHTVCLCRRPRNSRFHLQGIARELPFQANSERAVTRSDTFLLGLSAVTAIITQSLMLQYTHPEPRPAVNELAKSEEPTHAFRK